MMYLLMKSIPLALFTAYLFGSFIVWDLTWLDLTSISNLSMEDRAAVLVLTLVWFCFCTIILIVGDD